MARKLTVSRALCAFMHGHCPAERWRTRRRRYLWQEI